MKNFSKKKLLLFCFLALLSANYSGCVFRGRENLACHQKKMDSFIEKYDDCFYSERAGLWPDFVLPRNRVSLFPNEVHSLRKGRLVVYEEFKSRLTERERVSLEALARKNYISFALSEIEVGNKKEWHVTALDMGNAKGALGGIEGLPLIKIGDPVKDNDFILNFPYLMSLYFTDFDKIGIDFEKLGELENLMLFEPPNNVSDRDLEKMKNLNKIKVLIFERCREVDGSFIKKMNKDSDLKILFSRYTKILPENIRELKNISGFRFLSRDGVNVFFKDIETFEDNVNLK